MILVRLIVYTALAWLTLAVILLASRQVLRRADNLCILCMNVGLRASTLLVVRINGLMMMV